jgi:hypothetical protein
MRIFPAHMKAEEQKNAQTSKIGTQASRQPKPVIISSVTHCAVDYLVISDMAIPIRNKQTSNYKQKPGESHPSHRSRSKPTMSDTRGTDAK